MPQSSSRADLAAGALAEVSFWPVVFSLDCLELPYVSQKGVTRTLHLFTEPVELKESVVYIPWDEARNDSSGSCQRCIVSVCRVEKK